MKHGLQRNKTCSSSRMKILMLAVGVIALGILMTWAGRNQQPCGCASFGPEGVSQNAAPGGLVEAARPRLLDLGATKCVPCKMMAPILDELREEYSGRLDVEFVDVWQNPDVARRHGVKSIPTQIFFDATGKELFRHQGFIAKEDILRK